MILIVEGTDGVGKTEFCRWYAGRTGSIYLHASAPASQDPFEEYVDSLDPAESYVLDRWFPGELVWPTLFDRKPIFDGPEQVFAVADTLHYRGAQLLTLWRDDDDIRQTLTERGETKQQVATSLLGQKGLLSATQMIGVNTALVCNVLHSDVAHAMATGKVTVPA